MLMAGLATSAMGIAALQDRLSGTGLPEGHPPCHISLLLALLFAFLDRARSAETSVSVSIRMVRGVFCIHYQRSIFLITFINKEYGARKIRTEGTGRQIYFLQYGFCASQR